MSTLKPDTTHHLLQLADITADWLHKAGMSAEADAVRALPPITDVAGLTAAVTVVQPMILSACRRAGVITWHEAQAGIDAARDAQGSWQAAVRPYRHGDPLRAQVDSVAHRLHTIACYAAHAAVTA
ncbi:hypothetical protein [Micromonospora sp. NPDC005174]|uniref:hypothetical protein n=1 Tax=Micromonospora sp. NPDC005174 TaxID=3157018 RepID=UPI0033B2A8E3